MKKIPLLMVWLMAVFVSLSLVVSAFGKPVAWDASLAMEIRTVLKKHRDNQVVLVDVRPKEEFDRVRIPDSIHVSLHFLKTKTFLKGKDLVLVGDGREWLPLESACRDLKANGFRVSILAEGVSGWLAAGGKVSGDAATLLGEKIVTPSVFMQEKDLEGRLMVYMGREATADLPILLPGCVVIDVEGQPEKAAAWMKKEMAARTCILPPLVLNATGKRYAQADAGFRSHGVGNVLFVEGGLAGYRTFLQGLKMAAIPREERLKTVGGCDTCGKEETFPSPSVVAPEG
jgi:rhodanese-related sulfurtransferase